MRRRARRVCYIESEYEDEISTLQDVARAAPVYEAEADRIAEWNERLAEYEEAFDAPDILTASVLVDQAGPAGKWPVKADTVRSQSGNRLDTMWMDRRANRRLPEDDLAQVGIGVQQFQDGSTCSLVVYRAVVGGRPDARCEIVFDFATLFIKASRNSVAESPCGRDDPFEGWPDTPGGPR